jgi:hypothetical protein
MAVGRKTGGRKKGSLNKAKPGIKAQKVMQSPQRLRLSGSVRPHLERRVCKSV